MIKLGPIPPLYGKGGVKELHGDWFKPLAYIPRRWTGVGFAMPPVPLLGTIKARAVEVQPGYPLSAPSYYNYQNDQHYVTGCDPTIDRCWGILGMRLAPGWIPIPCYFSMKPMVFGRWLHFSGGPLAWLQPLIVTVLPFFIGWWTIAVFFAVQLQARPDIHPKDWFWWIEFGSCTWTKPRA